MSIEELHAKFLSSAGISTDTRKLRPGEIFFALKGENFDGNRYVPKALEAGALLAVADGRNLPDDPRVVRVRNSLSTLQELAAWHRNHIAAGKLTVLGLTGTNGKTTTKELLRAVLSARYRVVATEGNLNNDIGVPLSVLRIQPDTEVAIIEMGASHPEDLKPLLAVSQPDCGLITNVGKAHLLGFGNFEGVKRAKGLLYDYLAAHQGRAYLNADDKVLTEMAASRELKVRPYGLSTQGFRVLAPDGEHPFLRLAAADGEVLETQLVGSYNAANVLAALAVGVGFGIPRSEAFAAVAGYCPANNRSQLVKTGRNTVIGDYYNANPSSMAVALDNLSLVKASRKGALLGDMRELGEDSLAEHVALLKRVISAGLDKAFFVGGEFSRAAEPAGVSASDSVLFFPDSESLAAYLLKYPLEGYTLLVKGSRGIQMEKVLPSL